MSRQDLHEAMARAVDGAMIWGGKESVLQVRSLPFPHWAKLAVFGPRISVAAMDAGAWSNPEEQKTGVCAWLAMFGSLTSRHVLHRRFCISKKRRSRSTAQFLRDLQRAFENENQAHPRREIPARLDFGDHQGACGLAPGRPFAPGGLSHGSGLDSADWRRIRVA